MASRKRERVGTMADAIAEGLAVAPPDTGIGAATGGVSVRAPTAMADGSVFYETQEAFERAMDLARARALIDARPGGPLLSDAESEFTSHVCESAAVMAAPPPDTWCVHGADWVRGKPVVARDPAGCELRGLTEAEARMAARLIQGASAVRES